PPEVPARMPFRNAPTDCPPAPAPAALRGAAGRDNSATRAASRASPGRPATRLSYTRSASSRCPCFKNSSAIVSVTTGSTRDRAATSAAPSSSDSATAAGGGGAARGGGFCAAGCGGGGGGGGGLGRG